LAGGEEHDLGHAGAEVDADGGWFDGSHGFPSEKPFTTEGTEDSSQEESRVKETETTTTKHFTTKTPRHQGKKGRKRKRREFGFKNNGKKKQIGTEKDASR
jgi:hypothetical protein